MTIAQIANAHWFFGNVYETTVRIPDRLTQGYEPGIEDRRLSSLLSRGSPVRYFLPGAPVLVGTTIAALLAGWKSRKHRPWFFAMAGSAALGILLTAWLVRSVNQKLFIAGTALTSSEQSRLLRMCYRLNGIRLITGGVALMIASGLAFRLLRATGSGGFDFSVLRE